MADEVQAEGVFINYRGREWTPDGKTQYASFEARVQLDTFAGTTHFEAVGKHLAWFADALSAFYATFSGQPELICGVGDDIYFRLKFSQHNMHGHVLVECDTRQNYRENLYHSLKAYHVIELYQVHRIAQFFQSVVSSDEPDSICIQSSY